MYIQIDLKVKGRATVKGGSYVQVLNGISTQVSEDRCV